MFDSKGRIHMKLTGQKIEEDLIKFLNKMAKSILTKIDPEKNINIFTGFDKQGNLKSIKYKLWELLKVVDQSKNS